MKLIITLVVVLVLFVPAGAMAQEFSISAETEVGNGGGSGNPSWFHQYIFANTDIGDGGRLLDGVNFLTRIFWVGDGLVARGEMALGPTFYSDSALKMLQFQFGATTEGQAMAATLLVAEIAGHDVVYIGDRKFRSEDEVQGVGLHISINTETEGVWKLRIDNLSPRTEERPGTFYQKLFVAVTDSGSWQVRAEHLLVGSEQAFFRVGPEYRRQLGEHQLLVTPFWDFVTSRPGFAVGYRF